MASVLHRRHRSSWRCCRRAKDVTVARCEFVYRVTCVCVHTTGDQGHQGQIKKAVQLLLAASGDDLHRRRRDLAMLRRREKAGELAGISVTNTLMGLADQSSDPASSACSACTALRSQHGDANCDVLLAVGARFDDRVIGIRNICSSHARSFISTRSFSFPSGSRLTCRSSATCAKYCRVLDQIAASGVRPVVAALKAWWTQINEWRSRTALSTRAAT